MSELISKRSARELRKIRTLALEIWTRAETLTCTVGNEISGVDLPDSNGRCRPTDAEDQALIAASHHKILKTISNLLANTEESLAELDQVVEKSLVLDFSARANLALEDDENGTSEKCYDIINTNKKNKEKFQGENKENAAYDVYWNSGINVLHDGIGKVIQCHPDFLEYDKFND